ncbi:MAG: hypothetical protein ACKPAH_06385, partial [Verrucomicrobiota bacterium]
MSPTDGPANVPDLIELTGDEAFVPDALAADTLSRVEGELRKLLKVSATEPGLRLRLRKPLAAGWVMGFWRYLSADRVQVWAQWAYPSNDPSALNFLATERFIPTEVTNDAQRSDPASFTIGEERLLAVWGSDISLSASSWIATWQPGRPLRFSAGLLREASAGPGLSVGTIRDALAAYPDLMIGYTEGSPEYFGINADFQASTEFPGLQPILDVHRTLQKLAKLGAGPANGTTAPPARPEPPVTQEPALTGNPRTEEPRNEAPANAATPSDRTASNPTEAPSPKLDSILREI